MASAWSLLGLSRDVCNVSKPAGPSSHKGALIVCIDVEASTYPGNEILEVGVAVLDTNDIVGVAPGAGGINWMKLIKPRHFMIRDHCHIVNKKYAVGCPEKSLFAVSEYITEAAAKYKIPPCWKVFNTPTSSAARSSNAKSKTEAVAASCSAESESASQAKPSPYRPVAFVGHDLRSDDSLIGKLGISLNLDHLIASYDTQVLSGKQRKLSEMLTNLGIPWQSKHNGCNDAIKYTHNGCNDAVFTLQAFIAILTMSPETRESFVDIQRAHLTIPPSIKIKIEWDPKLLTENKRVHDSWAKTRKAQRNAMFTKLRQLKAAANTSSQAEGADSWY